MLSPANAAAAASLRALREELAQTHLRVHFYERRRENFEHEHPLPMAWGGSRDHDDDGKDTSEMTPAEKLKLLRHQLALTQSALQDTKKHVSALRLANGRSKQMSVGDADGALKGTGEEAGDDANDDTDEEDQDKSIMGADGWL
jgi:hypothetical protein